MAEYGCQSLNVWQRAKTLATDVYRLTRSDTIKRDFSLIDQLRRSAVSVPSEIAEGDERNSDRASTRFCHLAKGSLAELPTQLETARDVGYCTTAQVESLITSCAELDKMLGALIRARNRPAPSGSRPKP